MASKTGTLEQLALTLGRSLAPLETGLSSANALEFFAELGVRFPSSLLSQPAFSSALSHASSSAGDLTSSADGLAAAIAADDTGQIAVRSVELIARIGTLISALDTLGTQLNAAAGSIPGIPASVVSNLASNLGRKIVDHVLVSAIESAQQEVARILPFTGLIERIPDPGEPAAVGRPPYIKRRLRLDRLVLLFSDPGQLASDMLGGFGSASPDFGVVLNRIDELLRQAGVETTLTPAPPASPTSLSTGVFTLTPTPPGLTAAVSLATPGGFNFPWRVSDDWRLNFKLEPAMDAGLQVVVTPPLSFSFQPPSGSLSGEALFEVIGERTAPAAFVLIGQTDSSRLEVGKVGGGVGLKFVSGAGTKFDPLVEFELARGKLVIDTSSGDSFLGSIMSGLNGEANFDIKGRWTPSEGVSFEGSATLEIAIATHIDLGPFKIPTVYLITGLQDTGTVPIEMSLGISGTLGPLSVAVERMGLKADLSFPGSGGNLGAANLKMSFKPPNGVGLSIDAAVVKGGGYLYFDFDKEEYAGALELVFSGFITLKAIGLVTTRMPDGSKGFSLLIIITAEFGTGIQLGFGFVLLGVGGLLGLNRTMKLQPLVEGVRTGAVESVMFPKDVVANAPKIISDLRKFFPPQDGLFLIGPMAKLGWGTPALITVSLGIIIEIPGNIAILGVLKIVLPDEKAALLVLQVNFFGAIEFDKKRLFFFAAIFESLVLFFTIEGEMGLLVAWGGDANFVVSVGGFHPQYTPPPLPFPSPKRISFDILNQPFGRIRVMGYFAVTSNTVQLGARAELYFGISAFSLEGHLGFDALFQFNPFFFIIEISCGVSVKVFGIGLFSISLKFSLEGPTPWRAKGYGKIKILFFSIKVKFDVSWGEKKDTSLPPIKVVPILAAELKKLDNWKAELPAANNLLVSLRKLPEGSDLVLHPVGTLSVTQRLVPLDISLDKIGNQKPSDAKKFNLSVTSGLSKVGDREERFAIAQFQDFKDAEKLSKPAFQRENSGLELAFSGNTFATGKAVKRNVRYETFIIDSNFPLLVIKLFGFVNRLFTLFLGGNAISRAEISYRSQKQIQPFDDKVEVGADSYVVAFNSDNKPFNGQATFNSEAQAREFMEAEIARDPGLSDSLHVIPRFEMNQAA